MDSNPPKSDIDLIFNRLRSIPTNKSCFDCSAKNPSWTSITYGIFICIDCSSVHRNLGVHLSFVKSSNLDINWNWIQIRQMQLGGNAVASQFFRQQNCTTTDAQQKYTSRTAQLYRDKLLQAAQKACQEHGTNLHVGPIAQLEEVTAKDEDDFFAEHSNESNNNGFFNQDGNSEKIILPSKALIMNDDGAPSVDFLNSEVVEAPKSSIGVRKIQPKKSGMGAKKGLGAKKVMTNFADIEQRANLSDQINQIKVPTPEKQLTQEQEQDAMTSVRLAYQNMSLQKQKEEDRLKTIDPNKAKQMERLGMGFNVRGGVSHSMMTDMQTITQDVAPTTTTKFQPKSFDRDNSNDFFDDYSTSMYNNASSGSSSSKDYRDATAMGFETIEPIESKHNVTSMFSPQSAPAQKTSSVNDRQPIQSSSNSGNSYGGRSRENREKPASNSYDSDSIQKKFAGSKSISSDQFFGNDATAFERSANMTRFQGSNSISSADYFGDGTQQTNAARNRPTMNFSGHDLDDVRESVRQGVTKVAGRLSSIASDVSGFIQDKYNH